MEEQQECKYSDLIVTPARLDFENEEGSGFVPPPQDLFIKKAGGEGVLDAGWSLHITSQGSFWLIANPISGRGTGRARVFIKSGELAPGGWEGQIEIKIEDALRDKVSVTPSVIPVRLVVREKEEPVAPEPPPVEPPKEPEEPGEPEPPAEPPEEPPDEEPPVEPPPPPPTERCWLWRLIEKFLKLWSR